MRKESPRSTIALCFDLGTRFMLLMFLAWCAYRVFMNLLYLPGMARPYGGLIFTAALLVLELVFSVPLGYAVRSLLQAFAASLGPDGGEESASDAPDGEAFVFQEEMPAGMPEETRSGLEEPGDGVRRPAAGNAGEDPCGGGPGGIYALRYVFIGGDGAVVLETEDPEEAERFRRGLERKE